MDLYKSLACTREVGRRCVAGMCGRAVRARSLDGCSCKVIGDRCTVSLAYDCSFYMRGVRYVPMCAGALFVQDSLVGAHVR